MKKIFAIALAIVLAISMLTACGGSGARSSDKTPAGNNNAALANINSEDECDCCPECIKDDCDCDECDCCPPGGGQGSFTFLVETYAYVAGWQPIHKTYGAATVTMDQADGNMYFGMSEGAGEYTDLLIPETGQVETTFTFTTKLKEYDPIFGNSITVGLDRIGAEVVTNYNNDGLDKLYVPLPDMGNVILMMLGQDHFDEASGFYYFELPLEDGSFYKIFSFDRASADFEGHIELTIYATPVR
jgi:hypothetical protein